MKGAIMGTVFRKTPLPTGAKIIVRKGQRLAEWTVAERDLQKRGEGGENSSPARARFAKLRALSKPG
jgi:hypothetical protein